MPTNHAYPRPQLRRTAWTSLTGPWDFALDPDARWRDPGEVAFDRTITVPFAPETEASGVGDTGFYLACWYQRRFTAPELAPGERLLLHFGAVDDLATVWVNDQYVGRHEGGFTPFSFDITSTLRANGEQRIVLRAEDDPHDLAKPRGKQDWRLAPHSIWYPRTTGIWQTVWLETVPATRIANLRWTPDLKSWSIGLRAEFAGVRRDDLRLNVELWLGSRGDRIPLANDTYAVGGEEIQRQIHLVDPGIDDARDELLWRPDAPHLIQARLRLCDKRGEPLDEVESYTALRTVSIDEDRFLLNDRPCPLRLVLDQGYWPTSGMTAPDDAALRRDVELAKAMGFNGVRKHQKIEDPRYLYWADRLGLFVWEELPSAYRYTPDSVRRLTDTWIATIHRDVSHPCIITWVPFNESWGVPDLPTNPAHRAAVQALYHLTHALDGTRPVIGNDGWEHVVTDIVGIHDYDDALERITKRYGDEVVARLFNRERPGGRLLTLDREPLAGKPLMLTEFGGIACTPEGDKERTWGYARSADGETFARQYSALLEAIRRLDIFSGFCYTQFADTHQEANGLLCADRTPKFPLDQIARATLGAEREQERELARRATLASQSNGRDTAALPGTGSLSLGAKGSVGTGTRPLQLVGGPNRA
ncbi:MAG: glycoside hydrolase family 2 [Chloroflexota bacterium]|nr:glycoside hydrolase family 2 [Chloroflexota bacterium]